MWNLTANKSSQRAECQRERPELPEEERGRPEYIFIYQAVSVKACSSSNYEHCPGGAVPLETDESITHTVTVLLVSASATRKFKMEWWPELNSAHSAMEVQHLTFSVLEINLKVHLMGWLRPLWQIFEDHLCHKHRSSSTEATVTQSKDPFLTHSPQSGQVRCFDSGIHTVWPQICKNQLINMHVNLYICCRSQCTTSKSWQHMQP